MKLFETYLTSNGLHFKVAKRYGRTVDKYIQWVEANNLKVERVKRSEFTNWIQSYKEQGFKRHTLYVKENAVRYYYCFLGTKNNPATRWGKRQYENKLPPNPIEKKDLIKMYENLKPKSLLDYRNRCMLGFVFFQGLKRNELEEMRISDVDFKTGTVFVQGQIRSNSRRLKLESFQIQHLNEYFKKYRKIFLSFKDYDTDRFFLTQGCSKSLESSTSRLLTQLKRQYPSVLNFLHIRGSVITHWRKEDGLMEAMVKAGHCFVTSTRRYETKKYDELQEQLKNIHPMEQLNILSR